MLTNLNLCMHEFVSEKKPLFCYFKLYWSYREGRTPRSVGEPRSVGPRDKADKPGVSSGAWGRARRVAPGRARRGLPGQRPAASMDT